MSERTCPVCGVSITRTGRTRPPPTYCSTRCRGRASYQRRREAINAALRERTQERLAQAVKICPVCGGSFGPERSMAQKYCSSECRDWVLRHLNERTCERRGCDRPHRARGLCSGHYNEAFGEDRHAKVEMACVVCGAMVLKYKSNRKARRPVCSYRCRSFVQRGQFPIGKDLVGPLPWTDPPRAEVSVQLVRSTGGVFTSGPCAWCGESFVALSFGPHRARYCSRGCARGASKAKQGQFSPSPLQRRRIYERDSWVCQICMEPVDRSARSGSDWAPSLDHVVPQSWQMLPDHSESNLRLAHHWCNSVRGDETYYSVGDLAG